MTRQYPDADDGDRFGDQMASLIESPAQTIKATPFVCRDPRTIPPRQWLFARHYVRKYVTTTVAPAGLGKTTHSYVEGTSMVCGRALFGGVDPKMLRVWIVNLEDPLEETERRLAAVRLHFGLSAEDMGDRLFVDSGRTTPMIVATKVREAVVVAEPIVNEIMREIRRNAIDVMIVDPFVSSHGVPENDNGAIDRVAKTWARIADETGCAVELIHHVRKPANGSQGDFTVDDARGAVALIGAVRSARVLNVMSNDDAEKAGVPLDQRRSYFRVDDGKSNMQPPIDKAVWRKIVSVPLDNDTLDDPGDWIGVATAWTMPGVFDGFGATDLRKVQDKIATGEWAENVQANDWAGYAVADALGLDGRSNADRQRIKCMLKTWIANKALRIERKHDLKKGRNKPVVVVGEL